MKTIIKPVGFTTDCMGEVSSIKLELSDEKLEEIKKAILIVRDENTPINQATIWYNAELLDCEGNEADFRTDGGELLIFKDSMYYKTCHKHDSGVQFESEPINVSELFESELTPLDPIKEARELLRKAGYFVQNLWSDDDVIGHGESLGYEISEEQALEILELMGRRVDATIGVNWDFIESVIEEFFND